MLTFVFLIILILEVSSRWVEYGRDSHLNNLESTEKTKNEEWHKILKVPILNKPDDGSALASISDGKLFYTSYDWLGGNYVLTRIDLDTGNTKIISITSRGVYSTAGFIDNPLYYVSYDRDQNAMLVTNLQTENVTQSTIFTAFNYQLCLNGGTDLIGFEIVGGVFQDAALHVESYNILTGSKNWVTVIKNLTDSFIYTLTVDDNNNLFFLHKPDPGTDSNVIIKMNADSGEYVTIPIPFPITQDISQARISVSNVGSSPYLYFPASLSRLPTVDATVVAFTAKDGSQQGFSFLWKYSALNGTRGVGDVKISVDGKRLAFLGWNKTNSHLYSIDSETAKTNFVVDVTEYGNCEIVNILTNNKHVLTCYADITVHTYVFDSSGKEIKSWFEIGTYPFDPVFDNSNSMYYCVTNGEGVLSYSYCRKRCLN